MEKYLVLGMGVSGISAAEFLLLQKKNVLAVDKNFLEIQQKPHVKKLLEKGLVLQGEKDPIDFSIIEKVVLSPGISQEHAIIKKAQDCGIEIFGEIEFASRYIKNPVIGITGSNGKTTTSLLITHILQKSGKKAKTLGNVGTSLTSYLLEKEKSDEEIIVLELSSYQLESFETKIIDCGVILNITQNHLDRYHVLEDYAKAKCLMQRSIKKGGKFFVSSQVQKDFSSFLGKKAKVFDDEKAKKRLQSFKIENLEEENLMAAYAVCKKWKIADEEFISAAKSFKKPPHRIEFVAKIGTICFYNDSKSTSVASVLHAVRTLPGSIILIAGGQDKGLCYQSWNQDFQGKVRKIFAIGENAEKLKKELTVTVEIQKTLEDAVKNAYEIAKEHESILLSPGCASFDMFKNYEHRGEEFKRIVGCLVKGELK